MRRHAYYTTTVVVEWLQDEKRRMRLMHPVLFFDSSGIEWIAKEGDVIDGASIPRFFWRFIGSPFVGKYRRASVIHDVYCVNRLRPHKQVHKMFYEGMIVDGVSKLKAKAMFHAVNMFGPKW